jgi:hypothetical protein
MACRTKPWMQNVKPGDYLVPRPLWNRTSGRYDKLANPSLVQAVTPFRNCQSGVLFTVDDRQLDADWFIGPYDGAAK